MSDDYLFDGSGPPDAEVAGLESLLHPLRLRKLSPPTIQIQPRPARRLRYYLAASLALIAAASWWWWPNEPSSVIEFTLARGSAKADGRAIPNGAHPAVGHWIETDSQADAGLRIPEICEGKIGPDARVRVQQLAKDQCRLELTKGKVHVMVKAAPHVFEIVTPATTIIDLGCEYVVEVAADGDTRVWVATGAVELVSGTRRAIVTNDWRCRAHPTIGLGTPWSSNASPALTAALDEYDRKGRTNESLHRALASVSANDGLTLWALFLNAETENRRAIYDRAVALIPVPGDISADAAIRGNEQALAALRRAWTNTQ